MAMTKFMGAVEAEMQADGKGGVDRDCGVAGSDPIAVETATLAFRQKLALEAA
jgi:hypothetical protein